MSKPKVSPSRVDSNSCGAVAEDSAKTAQCNSDDRCQRQKQGGAVGAAASGMRVPLKARCSRWEPRPGFLIILRGSRRPPAPTKKKHPETVVSGCFFLWKEKYYERCSKDQPMTTFTSTSEPEGACGRTLPSRGLPSTVTLFTPYCTPEGLSTVMWYTAPR